MTNDNLVSFSLTKQIIKAICQSIFFILLSFSAENFLGFRLNFINQNARTLGGEVDRLLNGSRINSLLKSKAYLLRGNTAFVQGNRWIRLFNVGNGF